MTYTAKTVREFRQEAGSLAEKITSELTLVDAAIDALGSGTGALTTGQIFVGAAGAAADVAMSGDVTIATGGATTIGAGVIEQAMHVAASEDGTVAKVVAETNVIGGIPLTFMIPVTAGALGDTDVTMTHKVRVLDAYLILRGAGVSTTTLQVKNGTSVITDAMAASGSDKALVRATTIDDAAYEIAAAGTLRVTSATGATQPAALVVVTAVRVT